MMKSKSPQVVLPLALILLAASGLGYTQSFDVVSLRSPNRVGGGEFGHSVSDVGDVNQDGFADVVIGAPFDARYAGRAYIFSGDQRSLLFELVSPNEERGGQFGIAVSSAGDVNQDGVPDVIIAANGESPGTSPDGAGRAYVFSGQDGTLLLQLQSPNEEVDGGFGISAAGAGDINQDGFADVIVGAGETPSGRAYVFSGSDGVLLFELASPHDEQFGFFGLAVDGGGDLSNDGFPDLIVGAPFEDPGASPEGAGRAYLFSGSDASLLLELASPNETRFGNLGRSVSAVGDVNQDGTSDVLVGAQGERPESAGHAYVFSGLDGRVLLELASPNETAGGQFGWSVSAAGDVNQDGLPDFIVGAPGEIPDGTFKSFGRAYVFSGHEGSLISVLTSPQQQTGGMFGYAVSRAGDVNQDGLPDLIVGAPHEQPDLSREFEGRAYVFVSGGA